MRVGGSQGWAKPAAIHGVSLLAGAEGTAACSTATTPPLAAPRRASAGPAAPASAPRDAPDPLSSCRGSPSIHCSRCRFWKTGDVWANWSLRSGTRGSRGVGRRGPAASCKPATKRSKNGPSVPDGGGAASAAAGTGVTCPASRFPWTRPHAWGCGLATNVQHSRLRCPVVQVRPPPLSLRRAPPQELRAPLSCPEEPHLRRRLEIRAASPHRGWYGTPLRISCRVAWDLRAMARRGKRRGGRGRGGRGAWCWNAAHHVGFPQVRGALFRTGDDAVERPSGRIRRAQPRGLHSTLGAAPAGPERSMGAPALPAAPHLLRLQASHGMPASSCAPSSSVHPVSMPGREERQGDDGPGCH